MHTPRERMARLRAARWAKATTPVIDRRNWTDQTIANNLVRDILAEMEFPKGRYAYIVDVFIRLRLGALSERDQTGARSGPVSQRDYEREAAEILRLVSKDANGVRHWPIEGAAIPAIPAAVLQTILNDSKWRPDGVENLEDAMNSLIGQFFFNGDDIFHPEFVPAVDGILQQYEYFLDNSLVSIDPKVRERFLDPETGSVVSTIDPLTQEYLSMNPVDQDGKPNALFYYGGSWDTGIEAGQYPPSVGLDKRRKYQDSRRVSIGGRPRQTMRQVVEEGRKYSDSITFQNRAFRTWHRVVAAQGMANPEIMLWGPAEALRNATIEGTVQFLTGQTALQQVAKSKLQGRLEQIAPDLANSVWARAIRPDVKPWMTAEDAALRKRVIGELAGSKEWRSIINQESHHKILDEPASNVVDRGLDKTLDVLGRMQDPASWVHMKPRATLYVDSILRYMNTHETGTTAREVLLAMHNNREFAATNTLGMHQVGVAAVQRGKGFERTLPAALYDAGIGAAADSSHWTVNSSANLLKGLTVFQNFFWTVGTVTTGMQGVNAIAAVLAQGNTSGKAWSRTLSFLSGGAKSPEESGVDLIGQVLGQANLAQAMLRGQVSQMHLFMIGMILGSVGLNGEDEEERRRRKAQLSQGLGEWNDPADIENDFRNYNAIYLDNIPLLGSLFAAPANPGQESRSPVQLHWTLKLFMGPAMGMADFLDTGNPAYLIAGVQDAVGSLPFASVLSMDDAAQTVMDLASASAASAGEAVTPGEFADALDPLMKGIFLLERVTMENSFISSLYNNLDTYTRNPWVFAEINETGDVVYQANGTPASSEALEYKQNVEDGTVYEGEIYRNSSDGANRAVISQRPVLATMLNLLFSTSGTINSFNRYDMVPSEVLQYKTALGFEDAETLILTIWDPKNNREVLTRDGADRLLQSLAMGSVKATDPALDGVFIDIPTRVAVAEDLQKRIVIEGMETLGLTPQEAEKRMWNLWNGPKNNPHAIPLRDVVWNEGDFSGENGISWSPTARYTQLNTTWATGPDGKKWATGLRRGTLYQAFGVNPYEGSAALDPNSNMPTDGNLNNQDVFTNVNLGRRALEKVGSNWDIPNAEDLANIIQESTDRVIEALKDLQAADYDSYNKRGGYATGGGGGRGGYANNPLLPFLNNMKNPYADNAPSMYINNINVRRASVRRERFSSERGRLNNQQ